MNGGFTEKDVEDWLFEHPESVGMLGWAARQLELPSGRLDLLGHDPDGDLVVVEIKARELRPEDIAQVCRYAYDVEKMAESLNANVYQMLVGLGQEGGLPTGFLMACKRCDVWVRTFETSLEVSGSYNWNDSFLERREKQLEAVSRKVPWLRHLHGLYDAICTLGFQAKTEAQMRIAIMASEEGSNG